MPDTFRIQMAKEYAMSRSGVIGKLYHSIVEVEPLKEEHQAGDEALHYVAETIRLSLRQ